MIITQNRQQSDSKKWHKYAQQDVIPMWIADSDFAVAPEIQQALNDRLAHPVYGYPYDEYEFLGSIIDHCNKQYGWKIDESWIVPIPGCVPGLNFSRAVSINKGKNAGIVLMPSYPPFFAGSAMLNFNHQKVDCLYENNQWIIDFDAIEASITEDTGLLMLCHPYNPIGKIYRDDELEKFAKIAEKHQLIVCSDEIHCDLILNGQQHRPFASLNSKTENSSITLMAASKTFNIAGFCTAFAIIPNPDIRDQFKATAKGLDDVNIMGRVATTAAYKYGGQWLEAQLNYLNINRQKLADCIGKFSFLSMPQLDATYLAFVDCNPLNLDNPQKYFESKGLGFAAGENYGRKGFVRINLACSHETMDEAMRRFEQAIRELSL